jgi:hypothetical protein
VIDPTFDVIASIARHADSGPGDGQVRDASRLVVSALQKGSPPPAAVFAVLRPLLPYICPANSVPPVFASFAGASTLARALVLSTRLVPQSDSDTKTMMRSDALAEASITRALLKQMPGSGLTSSAVGALGVPNDADAIASTDEISTARAAAKAATLAQPLPARASSTLQRLEKIQAKFGIAKK